MGLPPAAASTQAGWRYRLWSNAQLTTASKRSCSAGNERWAALYCQCPLANDLSRPEISVGLTEPVALGQAESIRHAVSGARCTPPPAPPPSSSSTISWKWWIACHTQLWCEGGSPVRKVAYKRSTNRPPELAVDHQRHPALRLEHGGQARPLRDAALLAWAGLRLWLSPWLWLRLRRAPLLRAAWAQTRVSKAPRATARENGGSGPGAGDARRTVASGGSPAAGAGCAAAHRRRTPHTSVRRRRARPAAATRPKPSLSPTSRGGGRRAARTVAERSPAAPASPRAHAHDESGDAQRHTPTVRFARARQRVQPCSAALWVAPRASRRGAGVVQPAMAHWAARRPEPEPEPEPESCSPQALGAAALPGSLPRLVLHAQGLLRRFSRTGAALRIVRDMERVSTSSLLLSGAEFSSRD